MEQAISTSHNISSSPLQKSLSKPRTTKRNYPKVPSLQITENPASIHSSPPTPNSSTSLDSPHSSKQSHAHIIKNGEKWLSELHTTTGIVTDVRALIAVLKICAESPDPWLGLQIHALLTKSALDAENLLRCSLMDFYADRVSTGLAEKLFDEAPVKCNLLWNKAVTMSAEKESWSKALELFRAMQSSGLKADEVTIAKVLNACGRIEALSLGGEVHGHVVRSGLSSDLLVSNSLITMYSKNSSIDLARRVFESMTCPSLVSWNSMISCCSLNGALGDAMELFEDMVSSGTEPDIVTWNCLISGHSHHGSSDQVFDLFRGMQAEGLKPNSSTITSVLRAVTESNSITYGKEIHGYVIRQGLESNVYIGTSLIDMYLKCYRLIDARNIFDAMKHRNVVTWNSLISGYAYAGHLDEALELLKQMDGEGLQPNLTTWNGLISGYSMKGQSRQALVLIRELKAAGFKPNVISWTALISGCCQNEQYEDSLYLFTEMQKERIEPNSATLATVLRACANLALLNKGMELHCFATRKDLVIDAYVATSLIDMYSKSGSLQSAHQVFLQIKNKNLASWNAMIMGFATYGQAKEASMLFDEMCTLGVKPDGITFTALLSGCRHSGMISEGWMYFDEMKTNHGVTPRLEHYTSMVDLLARGGYLDEAVDFIEEMPIEPDARLWGALLGACRIHRNLELAELAARHLFKLEPCNSANYLLMTSLYAYEGRWDDVENMRIAMNAAGLESKAGWSWIQTGQTVHVFSAEGNQHPDIGEIYFELYQLVSEMRRLGYVPDTSCIVYNVSEEEKEKLLMSHTEKLAITYGLISTSRPAAIRVIKNTRVCNDCHTMAKFASEITGREIYLRDGVRFHHFRNGKCSCNDYW